MSFSHTRKLIYINWLFVVGLAVLFELPVKGQVYSVGIYSGGRTIEHQWLVGTPTRYFGFTQYREYQDAQGRVLLTSHQHLTAKRAVFTQIHLWWFDFTIPLPVWGVGVVFFLLLGAGIVAGDYLLKQRKRNLKE
jgi:hypothetical protein